MKRIICPKCRSLGLATDCTDQLHMRSGTSEDSDNYELEVTVRFGTPVTSSLAMDPVEMATHQRDYWIDNPEKLLAAIGDALDQDADVTVRPAFLT